MISRDEKRLNHQLDRLELLLPKPVRGPLNWLREPSSRWIRLPIGFLLVLGGVFSLLPLLGVWMLPLGLILLAQDIPVLRRPTRRGLLWIERRAIRWKLSRRRARSRSSTQSPD